MFELFVSLWVRCLVACRGQGNHCEYHLNTCSVASALLPPPPPPSFFESAMKNGLPKAMWPCRFCLFSPEHSPGNQRREHGLEAQRVSALLCLSSFACVQSHKGRYMPAGVWKNQHSRVPWLRPLHLLQERGTLITCNVRKQPVLPVHVSLKHIRITRLRQQRGGYVVWPQPTRHIMGPPQLLTPVPR